MSQFTINPLLEKIKIPGESFKLPSSGVFYKDGELASHIKNGEIHIYPMTTIDEIVIKSPDKLMNGDAIKEVFSRCVPDIMKPGQLFTQDIDFILACLRKVSFGSEISMSYTHSCEDAKEHSYSILIDDFLKRTTSVDNIVFNNSFELKLDNGQVVKLSPLRYDEFIEQSRAQLNKDNMATAESLRDHIVKTTSDVINSVDNINDKTMIREWLTALPVLYLKQIFKGLEQCSKWGVIFEETVKCKDCQEEIIMQLPLNPLSFFS